MILYLDTSALVKRYIVESGTAGVNDLIQEAEIIGSSVLTQIEMAAAIGKAVRMKWVDQQEAVTAYGDFLSQWGSITRLSLTPVLVERASRIAWDYGLRGYDATHLTSALIWQETIEASVTMVTLDRELWHGAKKAGLVTWPEKLPG